MLASTKEAQETKEEEEEEEKEEKNKKKEKESEGKERGKKKGKGKPARTIFSQTNLIKTETKMNKKRNYAIKM